ncbi:DMT family transporter [Wenyingzhuangia sp. IMCC45533]
MSKEFKNILELNLALLIIATAAPLGNYISLPPEIGIWSRCLFAFITIGIFSAIKGVGFTYNYKKDTLSFVFCAFMQTIHWVTYFYALQMAGAGLGVISLFTFPIFTTLLEPIILRTKFNPKHLFLALLVILGLYILTPEFNTGNQVTTGILFGIFSAFCFAIRNILMKKHVGNYPAGLLMFYQNGWVVVFLTPMLFLLNFEMANYKTQLPYLVFLGVITTAIGHTYLVKTFKYFSATTASLLSCIQPLYVVILAYFFLNEKPTLSTIIGGSIIVSAVVLESFISNTAKSS